MDIHCGGPDNAAPHHTNEIAQSEAYLGHKWVNYCSHLLPLNTTAGTMSASSGEFLTVSLLEQKGYDPIVYRFFCLQSHYRKNLVFSYENLDNAVVAYNKLVDKVAALDPKAAGEADRNVLEELKARFMKGMDADLNTSLGITALYDVLKAKTNDATKLAAIGDFDRVLGLNLLEAAAKKRAAQAQAAAQEEHDPEIEAMLAARTAAKKEKNFAEADRIRDELKARGIEIIDTPQGPKWKRI